MIKRLFSQKQPIHGRIRDLKCHEVKTVSGGALTTLGSSLNTTFDWKPKHAGESYSKSSFKIQIAAG